MKKLFVLGILLLPLVASASTLQCVGAPIAWGTLVTQGGCEAGDLVFTNFHVVSGSIDPLDVTVTISFSGGQNQFTLINLNDADGFTSNFQMSYNLAMDFTAPANTVPPLSGGGAWAIVLATAGLQDNGGGSNVSWQKTLSGGASGSTTTTYSGGVTTNGTPIYLGSTAFTVTDTYSAVVANGDILDLSNRFTQGPVPEPSTIMMLLGGALVGLGVIGRKRRKNG
jgi:hypothetical protein